MRAEVAFALFLTAGCSAAADAQPARVSGHAPGAGGVTIYYEIVGAAPDTVLFLHGTPSTMYSLARDFDELARDFTLVFFDQRGGGRSTPVLGADSLRWQDHVADMEALRAHLGIGRMHLFGTSWGSALAVLYAHAHPDRVGRLVLLPMRVRHDAEMPADPGPLAVPPDPAQQRRLQELSAQWARAADPVAVCEEYWRLQLPLFFARPERAADFRSSLCEEPPETLRHSWTVSSARMRSLGQFDLRPTLAEIRAPALIVKGTITTMPHAWTEEWARALPDARMHWVRDAGLLPWLEQPDDFFPVVRQFLRGNRQPTRSSADSGRADAMNLTVALGCVVVCASGSSAHVVHTPSRARPADLSAWDLDGTGGWRIADGRLVLDTAGIPDGPIRRPAALAILKSEPFGRVSIRAEIRSTARVEVAQRDLQIIVAYESPARFYYVHLAGVTDAVHNGIFLVADRDRRRIDAGRATPQLTDRAWRAVRVRSLHQELSRRKVVRAATGRRRPRVRRATHPARQVTDAADPHRRCGMHGCMHSTGPYGIAGRDSHLGSHPRPVRRNVAHA